MLFQDVEGLRTQYRHRGAGKAANFIEHLAAADHDKCQFHFVEDAHREIWPLVRYKFADHQVIVTNLGWRRRSKTSWYRPEDE